MPNIPNAVAYARFHTIDDFHRIGWVMHKDPLPFPHGAHAVSMEWLCDCPIVMPKDTK